MLAKARNFLVKKPKTVPPPNASGNNWQKSSTYGGLGTLSNANPPPLSAPQANVIRKNVNTVKFKNSLTKYINSVKALTEQNRTNNKINGAMAPNLSAGIVNGVKNAAKSVYSVSSAALNNPAVEPVAAEVANEAAKAAAAAANALKAQTMSNSLQANAQGQPSPGNIQTAQEAAAGAAAAAANAAKVVANANSNISKLNNAMKYYVKLNNANMNAYIASGRNESANNLLNKKRTGGQKYDNFFTRVASRKITKAGVNAALAAQPPAVVSAVAPVVGYENMTPANLLKVTSFMNKTNQNKFIAAVNKKLMSTNVTNANKNSLQKLKNNYSGSAVVTTGSETSTPASVNYKTMSVANLLSKVNSVPNSNKIALRNAIIAKRKNKNTGGPAKEKLANALRKLANQKNKTSPESINGSGLGN
jgi:hypothetical protein